MAISVPAAAALRATPLPATTDEGLAALTARGSQRAFTELYRRHREPLYRYCHGILREHADAEDAVQGAMTRALVALEAGTAPTSLQAWLFGIARNQAIDQLRARGRHEPLDGAGELVAAGHETLLEHRERLGAVLGDLARLPQRQRSALVLRELRGLSDREIAAVLAVSSEGVRQAVFEARTALKDFTLGREMACAEVRAMIAGGDRRRLRARQVRAHLSGCASCSAAASHSHRAFWWLPMSLQDLAVRVASTAPATSHEALAGSTVIVKSLAAAAAATTIGFGLADRPPVAVTPGRPAAEPPEPAIVRHAAPPTVARPVAAETPVERHRAVASPPAARPVVHRPAPAPVQVAPRRPPGAQEQPAPVPAPLPPHVETHVAAPAPAPAAESHAPAPAAVLTPPRAPVVKPSEPIQPAASPAASPAPVAAPGPPAATPASHPVPAVVQGPPASRPAATPAPHPVPAAASGPPAANPAPPPARVAPGPSASTPAPAKPSASPAGGHAPPKPGRGK